MKRVLRALVLALALTVAAIVPAHAVKAYSYCDTIVSDYGYRASFCVDVWYRNLAGDRVRLKHVQVRKTRGRHIVGIKVQTLLRNPDQSRAWLSKAKTKNKGFGDTDFYPPRKAKADAPASVSTGIGVLWDNGDTETGYIITHNLD